MNESETPRVVLERHLQAILDGDVAVYHDTALDTLTLYEWYVTPHRIEGLGFHDFLMAEAGRPDNPGTALDPENQAGADKDRQRFDLAHYHEARHGETVICCYTLLVSRAGPAGTVVRSHNETRVLVRQSGKWRVAHVHKSPAWKAPYQPGAAPYGT